MILLQPQTKNINEYIELADEYGLGFEITNFMFPSVLDDRTTKNKLIKMFKNMPYIKAFHGPFVDLNYSGGDPLVFKASKKRIEQCAACAMQLGVEKMVLHSCFFPVLKKDDILYQLWSGESSELLKDLSKKYNMTFCIENMLDKTPDIIYGMLRTAEDPRIKTCLDAGHANLTPTKLTDWVKALGKDIIHIHLSDNGGFYDDHMAIGTGTVGWQEFFDQLQAQGVEADFVLEVNNIENVRYSIKYLQETGNFEKLSNCNRGK